MARLTQPSQPEIAPPPPRRPHKRITLSAVALQLNPGLSRPFLLALCVGFCATAVSVPTHAEEDVVEPDDCIELDDASIFYGDPPTPLESSVAVGCGAEIERKVTGYSGESQPLATWEHKNTKDLFYTVRVDCGRDNAGGTNGVCTDKGDAQIFVEVGEKLYKALENVGDKDLTPGQVTTLNAIMDNKVNPVDRVKRVDLDNVLNIETHFDATGKSETLAIAGHSERVENAVAVGSGSKVHQAGGVAIGQNATVGGEVKLVPQTGVDKQGGLITGFKEEGPGGADGIAIGNDSEVTGDNGIALGKGAKVTGDNGIAIGNDSEVTGDNGIAIGAKVSAGKNEIRIGDKQTDVKIGVYDLSKLITIQHDHEQIQTNKSGITALQGRVGTNETDIAELDKHLSMVDERVSQVAAMAAALSAVPNAPDRDDRFFFGVGVGSHAGESGVALGISGRLGREKRGVVNFGAATSGGETTLRAGIGWSF